MSLGHRNKKEFGFSAVELLVVILIISILAVVSIPLLMKSRQALRGKQLPEIIQSEMRFARQQAMSQQTAMSLTFDANNRRLILSGGTYGAYLSNKNKITRFDGGGLNPSRIKFAIPSQITTPSNLDGVPVTTFSNSGLEVFTFLANGAHSTVNGTPLDKSVFFYVEDEPNSPAANSTATAAAISVLGSSGRVRIYRYDKGQNAYVYRSMGDIRH